MNPLPCIIKIISFTRPGSFRGAQFLFSLIVLLSLGEITWGESKKGDPVYDEQGWRLAVPGWQYTFPTDHGSHDEFQTEWWYFTGNLFEKGTGRRFGYQLTFFRQGITPPSQIAQQKTPVSQWRLRNLYFAHFALSDPQKKRFIFDEKVSRAIMGMGFYSQDQFWTQIGSWYARAFPPLRQDAHPRMEEKFELQANTGDVSIHLFCTRGKRAIFNGRNGVSQKAAGVGRATHYYSMTRLDTQGIITIGGKDHEVEGLSWFDKEFGTNQLDEGQQGWDWLSIQLNQGEEIMVYGIRQKDGSLSDFSSGTLIDANGRSYHLARQDFEMIPVRFWTSPETGARYPIDWEVKIPRFSYRLAIKAVMESQELRIRGVGKIDYWEGAIDVTGSKNGKVISGHGFLEMTGYSRKLSTR